MRLNISKPMLACRPWMALCLSALVAPNLEAQDGSLKDQKISIESESSKQRPASSGGKITLGIDLKSLAQPRRISASHQHSPNENSSTDSSQGQVGQETNMQVNAKVRKTPDKNRVTESLVKIGACLLGAAALVAALIKIAFKWPRSEPASEAESEWGKDPCSQKGPQLN